LPSFGQYLSRERELRALTREDVATGTRLSATAIAALEEDRFEALPAEAFTLGYIRSYASCIGLDPDDAVLRYQEARQQPDAPAVAKGVAKPPGPSRPWWLVPAVLGAASLAALAVVGYFLMR
jgi:cytoskeletal protein RodZ